LSAGCVPLSFSWSDASVRLSAQSSRNIHGQELLFTSSKVESRSKYLFFCCFMLVYLLSYEWMQRQSLDCHSFFRLIDGNCSHISLHCMYPGSLAAFF
jgi:hypothetical protein